MNINGQNSSGRQQVTDSGQCVMGGERWVSCGVNIGSRGKHSDALWAMRIYERFGLRRNVHIRRVHYWALLQEGLTLPSGKAYRNTVSNFIYLKNAFEGARLLGLIPYDVFSDRCGSLDFKFSVEGGLGGSDNAYRALLKRTIEQACRRNMRNMLARFAPVHLEVWLEGTSGADIVFPLAEKYNLNIMASEGDITLTSIWHFIRRVGNISKPVRILYICDFDPGSLHKAAVEKVTTVMDQYGLSRSVDLKVMKMALTEDECLKYDLPCIPEYSMAIPLKSGVRFAQYPTELHAMEVAAPGFLCQRLERYIKRYTDDGFLKDAKKKADKSIERLLVKINGVIDDTSDIYGAFEGI